MTDVKVPDAEVEAPLPEAVDPRKERDEEDFKLVIEDKTFIVSRRMTAEQEFVLMDLLDRAGLKQLIEKPPQPDDLGFGQFGYMATLRAFRAGVLWDLIATLLVEDGTTWTMARAKTNAALFATREDAESKGKLREVLVQALLGFFVSGIGFDATSPNFLAAPVTRTP